MHIWTLNAFTTNKFYAAFDISFLPDSLSHAFFHGKYLCIIWYLICAYMRKKHRNISIRLYIYKYVCLHGHFIALSCLISSYYSQHFSFYSCLFQLLKPLLVLLYYFCGVLLAALAINSKQWSSLKIDVWNIPNHLNNARA